MEVEKKYKLRYKFEITSLGDMTVAVGIEDSADSFHGMVKLENDTALFLFKKLQNEITLQSLIDACLDEYPDSSVDDVEAKVKEFIDTLGRNGLIG